MSDQTEIERHREQIAKNRELIEELEAGSTGGGDVFPETQAEIDRLNAQTEQSELIVAASKKEYAIERWASGQFLKWETAQCSVEAP